MRSANGVAVGADDDLIAHEAQAAFGVGGHLAPFGGRLRITSLRAKESVRKVERATISGG